MKDYDAIAGEGPSSWPRRFDTSRWGLLAARDESGRIGGAVVVPRSRRPGGASLFDLRVHPAARSRGVGSALFGAAEAWASSRGCSVLDVETQNVNVAACRFYAAMGCALSSLDRHAYPALPDEVQLVWSKSLERPTTT